MRLSKRHPHSLTGVAIERVLARVPYIAVGGAHRREIALTFDDGPGPLTPRLLKVLRRHHVPATFFVVGQSLNSFGATLPLELRDHFVIGDHTENHRPLGLLSEHDQRSQLVDQAYRIHSYGAPYPRLFRPPYRSFDQTTLALARKLHMLMVLWTVDSIDYRQPGANVIFERVIQGARPGAIILMHDAGGTRTQTLAVLPAIIKRLRAMHYRLVTVPRLVLDDPPPKGQPLPTGAG
jgi:peptidoglycan/xylan/chitin deacetylase (PgdA/CDA1 family)